ncbi:MAG: hypothetical protein IKP45_04040 [Bacteroidales bacterium]|nr:hypothetical protein [Bacteroidales bacterium]
MKHLFLLYFLGTISVVAFAQKSAYIKDRLYFDLSYTLQKRDLMNDEVQRVRRDAFSLSACYGVTKFWEPGLYYSLSKESLGRGTHFVGIKNNFHILPFFIKPDNRFFRVCVYVTDVFSVNLIYFKSYGVFYYLCDDIGLGASIYFAKHIGLNLEYRWGFMLTGKPKRSNFQNVINFGLCFRFLTK